MIAMHVFIGLLVWLIERGNNTEFDGIGTMLWFSVTIIFYAHRQPLTSNLSRLVLTPWLFVILIVVASFTASLSSAMTVSRLEPSVLDIETLQRTNAPVGCNGNSFIKPLKLDMLKQHSLWSLTQRSSLENTAEVTPKQDLPSSSAVLALCFQRVHLWLLTSRRQPSKL